MSQPQTRDDAPVVIAVVRSGGIAGLRRHWQVEPEQGDAIPWIALIEDCPWDDSSVSDDPSGSEAESTPPRDDAPLRGADRFVWLIRVRTPSERREQEVADSELDGPWRHLVDAVRAAAH